MKIKKRIEIRKKKRFIEEGRERKMECYKAKEREKEKGREVNRKINKK